MGLLKGSKPEPEPEVVLDPNDEDLTYRIEAFTELGCDPMTALACAWENLSPSALREFLRTHPKCDLETALAILL